MPAQQAADAKSLVVRHALNRLGEKWIPALLSALAGGPRRYHELHRELPVAPKVLTTALRTLESDGFIARLESPSIQVQVNYELTAAGRSLLDLLRRVEQWADAHHATFHTGAPLHQEGWRATRRDKPGAGSTHGKVDACLAPLEAVMSHVCIAVRDIERTSKLFSTVIGAAAGPMTADEAGEMRHVSFTMSNFCIEMIQAVDRTNPLGDFVGRFGPGLQHIGLRARGGFEDQLHVLEHKGGRRTLGGQEAGYALFDFGEQLGSTVEIMRRGMDTWASRPPQLHSSRALANSPVSHVTVMVDDVEDAAWQYSELLGVGASPIRMAHPLFTPDAKASPHATARMASLRYPGLSLLLIEPIGASPWRDFVDERGNAIHDVVFNVHDRLSETIDTLRGYGGRQLTGGPGVGYAQFDFTRECGLIVGLISAH